MHIDVLSLLTSDRSSSRPRLQIFFLISSVRNAITLNLKTVDDANFIYLFFCFNYALIRGSYVGLNRAKLLIFH